ncbi:haloacid dehalogenase-like hydrolase [Streptomyces smyrnaeus]|uniref:Haloacid dehalogenase-like hydrolase n=1 Tax=Streptomyces smyrnaeus TaxID=1387713 RepID=A0ABS3XV49_9ACTN|nr:haloacid dehalogenase-like hydrolase [Streptomyces smyrnaeus]MBO8199271.1 haloacid dehalogenase-like hydrolase [Streptomyces smyrnaeus]
MTGHMRPETAPGGRTAAFFDVESTLLSSAEQSGYADRGFAGWETEMALRHVRDWFRQHRNGGGLFDGRVLTALRGHARQGALIVLVSSAAITWLTPLAEYVGADLALGSLPEVRANRYTGGLAATLTGRHKADAVRRTAHTHGLDLARCHAYSGRLPNLPFLRSVGRPRVVGAEPGLVRQARREGWPCWPSGSVRRREGLGGLSDREMEVLRLLAEGRSNTGISQALCLSGKTVEAHVRSLYNKLGLVPSVGEHRRVRAVLAYHGLRPDARPQPEAPAPVSGLPLSPLRPSRAPTHRTVARLPVPLAPSPDSESANFPSPPSAEQRLGGRR